MQRGNVLLKQGDFSEARQDFQHVLQLDSSNSEARSQIDLTIKLTQIVQQAEQAFKNKDYLKAIELFSEVIEVSLSQISRQAVLCYRSYILSFCLQNTTKISVTILYKEHM